MKEIVKIYLSYLLQCDGIGSRKIIDVYEDLLERGGGQLTDPIINECAKAVPTEFYEQHKEWNLSLITLWDGAYPESLKLIPNPPAILYLKGDQSLLNKKIITLVGTREISDYGRKLIANLLDVDKVNGKGGCAYLSGLAYGVDAEVHKLALKCSVPTIAVVAGGIDEGYPKRNQYLYDSIVEQGLVISEFPPGSKVFKGMFPMRNRIMAALAHSIIIVQTGVKGGSIITANYGFKYGVDVYSVPGNIFDNNQKGCLKLIKEGAEILYKKEDFYRIIGIKSDPNSQMQFAYQEKVPGWLKDFLETTNKPTFTVEELIEFNEDLSVDTVMQVLTELEFLDLFEKKFGKYYSK